MKKLAISIGDLNGVGIEIALKSHNEIKKICKPIYCINKNMLQQASSMLNIKVEDDFEICEVGENFEIKPSEISALSGKYSYDSFIKAIELAQNNIVDGVVTMPIHKEAWMLAGLKYKGHTDLLREYFKKDAIMMLGCDKCLLLFLLSISH
jgi:4-hydroxythreonine-4-phosphate dehydrogenase